MASESQQSWMSKNGWVFRAASYILGALLIPYNIWLVTEIMAFRVRVAQVESQIIAMQRQQKERKTDLRICTEKIEKMGQDVAYIRGWIEITKETRNE